MRNVSIVAILFGTACTIKVDNVEVEALDQYWKANSTITLEQFGTDLQEEYWVHRFTDPTTSTLTEDWTAIDGTQTLYVYTADFDAATMSVDIYMDGELDGSGTGTFEAILDDHDPSNDWDWTYFEYGFTDSYGTNVVAIGELSADQLLYSSVGYGMDGQAEWTLDEVLTPMTTADWDSTFPSE